jgi:ABC-type uncharacterized transport system substrate-binding protein
VLPSSFWTERGGLARLQRADYYASGRQAARLVDKIIKGAKNPRIELVINLKVARELALNVPAVVVIRAERVNE